MLSKMKVEDKFTLYTAIMVITLLVLMIAKSSAFAFGVDGGCVIDDNDLDGIDGKPYYVVLAHLDVSSGDVLYYEHYFTNEPLGIYYAGGQYQVTYIKGDNVSYEMFITDPYSSSKYNYGSNNNTSIPLSSNVATEHNLVFSNYDVYWTNTDLIDHIYFANNSLTYGADISVQANGIFEIDISTNDEDVVSKRVEVFRKDPIFEGSGIFTDYSLVTFLPTASFEHVYTAELSADRNIYYFGPTNSEWRKWSLFRFDVYFEYADGTEILVEDSNTDGQATGDDGNYSEYADASISIEYEGDGVVLTGTPGYTYELYLSEYYDHEVLYEEFFLETGDNSTNDDDFYAWLNLRYGVSQEDAAQVTEKHYQFVCTEESNQFHIYYVRDRAKTYVMNVIVGNQVLEEYIWWGADDYINTVEQNPDGTTNFVPTDEGFEDDVEEIENMFTNQDSPFNDITVDEDGNLQYDATSYKEKMEDLVELIRDSNQLMSPIMTLFMENPIMMALVIAIGFTIASAVVISVLKMIL